MPDVDFTRGINSAGIRATTDFNARTSFSSETLLADGEIAAGEGGGGDGGAGAGGAGGGGGEIGAGLAAGGIAFAAGATGRRGGGAESLDGGAGAGTLFGSGGATAGWREKSFFKEPNISKPLKNSAKLDRSESISIYPACILTL